jgi:serine/threonine protein kinase
MRDRYLLLQEISQGAFGRVHLALDQATGRNVALKELLRLDADARVRFQREARMLYRQLNNRYVVDLLDHDFEHEPPYIVLEYCEHGSLRTWVDERRPWRHVAVALSHALQGLEGIHRVGGFHRDLKPENLLVASAPEGGLVIKIADFGLARVPLTSTGTMTQSPAGTHGYIAPEILAGGAFNAAADIYSLGVVATELLTGRRSPELLARGDAPPALRDLVLVMLSTNPANRPATRIIADSLNRILAPQVAPPPPPQSAAAPTKASTAGNTLGGLLLGGLLLAGLAALAGGGSEWDANVERYRGSDGRFRRG